MAVANSSNGTTEDLSVKYEDLAALEYEFDDVELDLLRIQYKKCKALYEKRTAMVAKIPNFWPLVFEQAPPEIDQFIQPSDSKIFAESLKSLEVTRFEIDDPSGSPRSFCLKFTFEPNKYFEDTVLEKKFWFRRASSGWTGLVSEPVKIHWKKKMDLTDGLTDAAVALWEAKLKRKKLHNGTAKKGQLPEYDALVKKIESSDEGSMSFFNLFGYISDNRYISAEESAVANAAEAERRAKRAKGEKVEEPEETEEEVELEIDIHPAGEELATLIAEDLWEGALKYFTQAQEVDDEELSELEDADDWDEGSDDDDEIDIRALVGKGRKDSKDNGKDGSPPAKKQRKN